jgi:hypothetical protein
MRNGFPRERCGSTYRLQTTATLRGISSWCDATPSGDVWTRRRVSVPETTMTE